jgi:hypothetical protein
MTVADRELPPTQYLVMEVLAARARTGESYWTFPTSVKPAITQLAAGGLVRMKAGVVERTVRVWMTDAGRDLFLMDGYEPPTAGGCGCGCVCR